MIDAIKTLIAREIGVGADTLVAGSGLDVTKNWDSIAQINICLALQDAYGLELSTEDISTATTVGALVELVAAKKAA